MHKFKSCFIVDVSVSKDKVTLTDSTHQQYSIDSSNPDLINQFKKWFKDVFSAGISGTLTVFEYEDRGSNNDFDFYIVKMLLKD